MIVDASQTNGLLSPNHTMEIRDHPIEIKEEPLDGRRSQEGIPMPDPNVDRVMYRKSPDMPYPVRNNLPTQVMVNGALTGNHTGSALNLSLPLPLPPGIPERPPQQPPLPQVERPVVDRRASFSSSGQDEISTDSEAVSSHFLTFLEFQAMYLVIMTSLHFKFFVFLELMHFSLSHKDSTFAIRIC